MFTYQKLVSSQKDLIIFTEFTNLTKFDSFVKDFYKYTQEGPVPACTSKWDYEEKSTVESTAPKEFVVRRRPPIDRKPSVERASERDRPSPLFRRTFI